VRDGVRLAVETEVRRVVELALAEELDALFEGCGLQLPNADWHPVPQYATVLPHLFNVRLCFPFRKGRVLPAVL
jgi:hypothetical protein